MRTSLLFGLLVAAALIPASAFGHGLTDTDKARMLEAGYLEYVWLGAKHMLTGYDHLLFLFGVVFFLTKFGDVLKFITAFTLGHCVTLIGATLLGIQANYYLIDAVIALTVIYKGFDNLRGFQRFFEVDPPDLLGMVFAFGLIHGFGLSTRLQQLPLGEDTAGIVMRILSFNVGVEVGQVLALGVMVAGLAGWRHTASFQPFSKACNAGLVVAGGWLLIFQLHGYSHTAWPDEFPLNSDDHAHIHEAAAAAESVESVDGPSTFDTSSANPLEATRD